MQPGEYVPDWHDETRPIGPRLFAFDFSSRVARYVLGVGCPPRMSCTAAMSWRVVNGFSR